MWRTNDVYYTNVARATYSRFWITTNSYRLYLLQITQPSQYWYTRMTGFGRRDIEYMQALCIYNKYIECYSVVRTYNIYQYHDCSQG